MNQFCELTSVSGRKIYLNKNVVVISICKDEEGDTLIVLKDFINTSIDSPYLYVKESTEEVIKILSDYSDKSSSSIDPKEKQINCNDSDSIALTYLHSDFPNDIDIKIFMPKYYCVDTIAERGTYRDITLYNNKTHEPFGCVGVKESIEEIKRLFNYGELP